MKIENTTFSTTHWRSLQLLTSLKSNLDGWRKALGDHLDLFKTAFLEKLPEPDTHYFCSRCHCHHLVIVWTPQEWERACGSSFNPNDLPDFVLKREITARCQCDVCCAEIT